MKMKTNLKLLKYDIKQILPVPAAILAICTLLNIVLMIMVGTSEPHSLDATQAANTAISTSGIVSAVAVGIIAVTVIYQLSMRIFRYLNITRLSKCNLFGTYLARLSLLFALMFAVMLILVLENTALNAVCNKMSDKYGPLVGNQTELYNMDFNMCGRPFGSWLITIAPSIMTTLILASVIAVAPLAYRINNAYVKWPAVTVCLGILLLSQLYVLPLFANVTSKLDFNTYMSNGVEMSYIPSFAVLLAGGRANTVTGYVSFNIFHGGVILFEALYFAVCLISGSLIKNKTRNRDDKTAKKFFALKLTALAVFAVFSVSVTIDAHIFRVDKNSVYTNPENIPGYREQVYDNVVYCITADILDLSDKLSFPAHPDTPKYKQGMKLSEIQYNTYYDRETKEYRRYKNAGSGNTVENFDYFSAVLDYTALEILKNGCAVYFLYIENTYTNKKYYCGYIMIVSTPVPVDELEWVQTTVNN